MNSLKISAALGFMLPAHAACQGSQLNLPVEFPDKIKKNSLTN